VKLVRLVSAVPLGSERVVWVNPARVAWLETWRDGWTDIIFNQTPDDGDTFDFHLIVKEEIDQVAQLLADVVVGLR
jgi:hypothetical protein